MLKISASFLLRFILWSCLAVLPLAHSAGAMTYNLHAIPVVPENLSDFTITFEDDNKNLLLDFGEIDYFSGLTDYGTTYSYSGVVSIPLFNTLLPYPPNLTATTIFPYTNGSTVLWQFTNGTGPDWVYNYEDIWTYTLTPVPLPPAALMFGTGLILLGWPLRKKNRGK